MHTPDGSCNAASFCWGQNEMGWGLLTNSWWPPPELVHCLHGWPPAWMATCVDGHLGGRTPAWTDTHGCCRAVAPAHLHFLLGSAYHQLPDSDSSDAAGRRGLFLGWGQRKL